MRSTLKKTVELLTRQGNDYLVGVKGNQPKLKRVFEEALAHEVPLCQGIEVDSSHGRQVQREVKVFQAPAELAELWAGAQSLVVVERRGHRDGHEFDTLSFYLSSLGASAFEFAQGIRGHRDIENGLHWVRDVVLQEDAAPFRCKTPALNWSILRSFTINLYRANGYQAIATAIRRFRDDLQKLFSLLLMN